MQKTLPTIAVSNDKKLGAHTFLHPTVMLFIIVTFDYERKDTNKGNRKLKLSKPHHNFFIKISLY